MHSWPQPEAFYPFFQVAAFWLALVCFRGPAQVRFALGLVLGAGCARVGWAVLHISEWLEYPRSLFDATGGFTLLCMPLGPLLLSPRDGSARLGLGYRAATARALTPAFALARTGCWLVGCCGGESVEGASTHPVALYEIMGWLVLGGWLYRAPLAAVSGCWLLGFGGIRLLLEPLRAAPPLGEPSIDVAWVAGAWMWVGAWLYLRDTR